MESETIRAVLGLANTPCHSNTFFKKGWPRYFSFIAVFRMAGHTMDHKLSNKLKLFAQWSLAQADESCSDSYPIGFCKHEKIKHFSTPPILIQLHLFKHRCHCKILACLKDQIFCLCWFFKRNTVSQPGSVFCPGLG